MYVIGTAGHIDHGKTLLIKQLSGIDCDRLPEEKQKGMTIDIGFAHIALPGFATVSIVDVPGHERFIKNMVAGAWGIDLALLVIAVDDGWMAQTEEHFNVLKLLNIERVIPVINKIDLADTEMIEIVEEEIKLKFEDSPYKDFDIAKISSKTGDGISALKEIIVKNLRVLKKTSNTEKPYLYVDRVFASKGYGTVITGTLKNGIFNENDSVLILPLQKEARIKRIESHNNQLKEGNPSQRTALNLTGISSSEIERGHIIVKNNFFTESESLLVRIQLLKDKTVKNNAEVGILIGTASLSAKIIFINDKAENESTMLVRVKCKIPWYFYAGESFIITNPGGYKIIAGGMVLLPRYDSSEKKRIQPARSVLNNYSRPELILFIISIKQWIDINTLLAMFSDNNKSTQKLITELAQNGSIIINGNIIIETKYFNNSKEEILKVIKNNTGLNTKELSDRSDVHFAVAEILMPGLVREQNITEIDGRYFTGESITQETLSTSMKDMLQKIKNKGGDGIELNSITNNNEKEIVKNLIKSRFVVSLDGNIIYHASVYEDLKNKIMALFNNSDKITIPQAKEAVGGLSRKYIIPLLNRIEDDKLIKRLGDIRIKA